jgi:hypothetical protein
MNYYLDIEKPSAVCTAGVVIIVAKNKYAGVDL